MGNRYISTDTHHRPIYWSIQLLNTVFTFEKQTHCSTLFHLLQKIATNHIQSIKTLYFTYKKSANKISFIIQTQKVLHKHKPPKDQWLNAIFDHSNKGLCDQKSKHISSLSQTSIFIHSYSFQTKIYGEKKTERCFFYYKWMTFLN